MLQYIDTIGLIDKDDKKEIVMKLFGVGLSLIMYGSFMIASQVPSRCLSRTASQESCFDDLVPDIHFKEEQFLREYEDLQQQFYEPYAAMYAEMVLGGHRSYQYRELSNFLQRMKTCQQLCRLVCCDKNKYTVMLSSAGCYKVMVLPERLQQDIVFELARQRVIGRFFGAEELQANWKLFCELYCGSPMKIASEKQVAASLDQHLSNLEQHSPQDQS